MRTSSQALPRPSRRPAPPPAASRSSASGASPARRPLQLELFGRPQPAAPVRPVMVPSPDAPRLELQRALNRLTGGRLKALTLTDNRRTILSVGPGRPGDRTQLAVRIHRCFVGAPPEILDAVA